MARVECHHRVARHPLKQPVRVRICASGVPDAWPPVVDGAVMACHLATTRQPARASAHRMLSSAVPSADHFPVYNSAGPAPPRDQPPPHRRPRCAGRPALESAESMSASGRVLACFDRARAASSGSRRSPRGQLGAGSVGADVLHTLVEDQVRHGCSTRAPPLRALSPSEHANGTPGGLDAPASRG